MKLVSICCLLLSSIALADESIDLDKSDTLVTFFTRIFRADFMPHGHCFFWRGELVWLHVISDGLIVLAYYSIPLMLMHFARKKKDLPYPWLFALFAGFIFWCGTTHVMNILTLWVPVYRAEGVVKFLTASISVLTAVMMFPLIPRALALRSPRELEKKNKELEEAYSALLKSREIVDQERLKREELERFANIASHDLKEPLRTISLFSDLLGQITKGKLPAEAEECVSHISGASSRMTSLIDDLVSYSLLDSATASKETFLLRECLEEARANLSAAIDEKKAKVIVNLPDPTPITGNRIQITQLFQNLIGNAIKFHRPDRTPEVTIDLVVEPNEWLITVKDNGIGFDDDFTERIFLLFKRLHSDDKYPGTGIGLAICKKIVERHGGKIWSKSRPGVGSTFFVSLPR
jgi:signal transduction histidine kinase